MAKFFLGLGFLAALLLAKVSFATPIIHIIAAENFYGSIIKEIGGSYVQVTSILNQPDQDPHLFNITPSIAKHLEQADLVIYNGLGYDPWIQNLLEVGSSTRTLLCVANLTHKAVGDNPHIWYDPATMPVVARAVRDFLIKKDPHHQKEYQIRYQDFLQHHQHLMQQIADVKARYNNTDVIATEPVFGYMAKALGFRMHGIAFQTSMMNGVDPGPKQVQAFQRQLQHRRVRILFYNQQVSSPLVLYLLQQAKQFAIPVVGVMETQARYKTYHEWMQDQLKQVEQALDERHRV
jgi:zinc/manganese transport system substrate-binding protein